MRAVSHLDNKSMSSILLYNGPADEIASGLQLVDDSTSFRGSSIVRDVVLVDRGRVGAGKRRGRGSRQMSVWVVLRGQEWSLAFHLANLTASVEVGRAPSRFVI